MVDGTLISNTSSDIVGLITRFAMHDSQVRVMSEILSGDLLGEPATCDKGKRSFGGPLSAATRNK
ncbi:hypothetical protein CCHR01_06079 [Colletotrichum chrysophilum]|uniref:Uncharacterized protein n=1 Tax=Colletotrichum chrysophilum TaxID=1836956 RepID=A0AAD9APV3_9PEZI|nr:hypothetical protein CCHR01_06079 [Colletotrichum chrysophilum]